MHKCRQKRWLNNVHTHLMINRSDEKQKIVGRCTVFAMLGSAVLMDLSKKRKKRFLSCNYIFIVPEIFFYYYSIRSYLWLLLDNTCHFKATMHFDRNFTECVVIYECIYVLNWMSNLIQRQRDRERKRYAFRQKITLLYMRKVFFIASYVGH